MLISCWDEIYIKAAPPVAYSKNSGGYKFSSHFKNSFSFFCQQGYEQVFNRVININVDIGT